MGTFSPWLFLLCISLPGAYGSFPDKVVVARQNDATPVTLICDTHSVGDVTWKFKKDGNVEVVEMGVNYQQDGRDLKVSDVDTPIVGEYSCWSGEEKTSSTYLLLDPEAEENDLNFLSCWANSYNCKFTCDWNHSEYTAVRLRLGHECVSSGEGDKSCSWVESTDELPDGGFHFELSHFLSPYTEESTMLEVTAEAISDYYFMRMTKRFYLRDIVKPDSPQKVSCQEVGQDLNVSIDPASSWSTPHSFFSLQHEIEYVYKDDGKIESSSSLLIPKGISKLRVRSRDAVVLSAWSQWTPWKNVKTGKKNLCKCKNTVKYCCPQLSSKDTDHCSKTKRRQKKNIKSKTN